MKNKIINFLIVLVLSMILLPGITFADQNSSTTCSLSVIAYDSYADFSFENIKSQVLADPDEIIYVAVIAQNVTDLDTYQIEIKYNNEVIEFIDAYEDIPTMNVQNFLKTNGGKTIGFQALESKSGIINIANTLIGDDTVEAPEGSGIIAVLKLKLLKNSQTKLSLINVKFLDSQQNMNEILNKNDVIIN